MILVPPSPPLHTDFNRPLPLSHGNRRLAKLKREIRQTKEICLAIMPIPFPHVACARSEHPADPSFLVWGDNVGLFNNIGTNLRHCSVQIGS